MPSVEQMELASLGIHVKFREDDITQAVAMIIGPPDTPYEDGILFFRISFPRDYPYEPPRVSYVSASEIRIHPNLYVGKYTTNYEGKVCLSVLNTWSGPKWTSAMTISSVLITLQSLLDQNPLRNEPGYEKAGLNPDIEAYKELAHLNESYNIAVQHDTLKHLIITHGIRGNTFQDMEVFQEEIDVHMATNLVRIYDKVCVLAERHPNTILCAMATYRMYTEVCFSTCKSFIHKAMVAKGS
jgi:ubiquitin-conjugating enzyme E2 Z